MPIYREELEKANQAMLGNTNRGILLTTVNMSKDAPRLSKYLNDMAAGIYTWDEFSNKVHDHLTVKSFGEFLDKFQPCFFYRLAPPKGPITVELDAAHTAAAIAADAGDATDAAGDATDAAGDAQAADAADAAESAAGDDATAEPEQDPGAPSVTLGAAVSDEEITLADQLPEYEFSVEGGPPELGWRRVPITLDHPLFKMLAMHLKERALTSKTTVNVSVDDALWGFKPSAAESLMRKSAQDFKSASKKLVLEMKRNPKSPETKDALDKYDRQLRELETAIGDDIRVLPTIASGLAKARKALGSGGGNAGPALGAMMLEIGERAQLVVRPALPSETLKGLPDVEPGAQKALGEGGKEIVLLRDAVSSRPLAKRAVAEITKLPDDDQFPALVGTLMSDMVARHKIQPVMGNMLAVILQDPQQLALWDVSPKEVEVFHDTFLGIYSNAVEKFLKAIVPMFETLLGVYGLFNEFPAEVRRGQPELIVTNDELTELWQIYNEEMATFFRGNCHQATAQYRDAIAFAIVPSVSPLKQKPPAPPPAVFIRAGVFLEDINNPPPVQEDRDVSALSSEFDAIRKQEAGEGGGYGRVSGASELMGLMVLGSECGFNVFFSPEKRVIAGRTGVANIDLLQEDYCPGTVVDKDWAVSGVLCLPDFVCLPPDGMLFTGKVYGASGKDGRSVGVEVPEIVIRSCYVAAGRFMANDNPEVLKNKINSLPLEQRKRMKVNPMLPGLSCSLPDFPILGETNLAPDHFLSDPIIRGLLGHDKSFLVFAHVRGQSPNIAAPRSLRRVQTKQGERYVRIDHWRQQRYLLKLLYAAYHIGRGGAWPDEEHMNTIMDLIINWLGWYDLAGEGYVNSFPSKLDEDVIKVEPIKEGEDVVTYIFDLPLKSAFTGPLELVVG